MYDKIPINHSENIIVNIKHATGDIVNEILPGYSSTDYVNTYNKCEKCWNCSHDFTGEVVSVPLKYSNNVFYIYGYFCSASCGARYVFDTFRDKNKWDIYSLMNLYENIQKGTINTKVIPAPSKLLLTTFGGSMDIKEYRGNSVSHIVNLPPIIPIEHSISKLNETMSIKDNKSGYKLYRKKTLKSKNNIYDTMNLCKESDNQD